MAERVLFRLIAMPCCNHMLCWVNQRLPSFCPECGEACFARLKIDPSRILETDDHATLIVHK